MDGFAFCRLDISTSPLISSSTHSTRHPTQTKISLPQRRQHPPADKQPAHERTQTPPVCGNDVEEDAAIRGHGRVGEWGSYEWFSASMSERYH